MRLWVKDGERLPDPEPAQTDDRWPLLVGTILWLVAGAVMLIVFGALDAAGRGWWLWVCCIGVGIGLVGLLVAVRNRRRARAGR
ncbi:DUF2530 domain-containing protein [Compostimonas suwonensis]|uniref:Uncharacterized protein DUF2530 n=1 Tax=Compostimonas suwonensis TaxID=1048394 RepID=A0A2M9BVK9_9MICO|nr:DUF2530 domain-containing protein [Compostimonas suwonensis]PJJ61982.1 uncharacterized protein DUF2530 [Compostimonas suwonensis]